MSTYTAAIRWALIIFPFLAAGLSLPFFIGQYRKYGAFNFWRGVVIYTFIFYLLSAYLLVILPLPNPQTVTARAGGNMNLIPFEFVRDFFKDTVLRLNHPSTYASALKQSVVIQPLANILMLLPFGVYLRYYFKRNWKQTILAAFCLSLFFELTQLSGLYGIYPHPYRLFDVDDLMMNTLGGYLGYLLAPFVTRLFPTHAAMNASAYQKGKRVSYSRRGVAFLIDWSLMNFVILLIDGGMRQARLTLWGDKQIWQYIVGTAIYFMLIPIISKGATFGKRLVKIQITDSDGHPAKAWQIIIRQVFLYWITLPLFGYLLGFLSDTGTAPESGLARLHLLIFIFACLVSVFIVHVLLNMFFRWDRLYYELIAGTTQTSTVKLKTNSKT